MNAVVYEEYGPPEVLELREVEKPSRKDDEVLLEVRAASVNYGDWALLSGKPFVVRLIGGGQYIRGRSARSQRERESAET